MKSLNENSALLRYKPLIYGDVEAHFDHPALSKLILQFAFVHEPIATTVTVDGFYSASGNFSRKGLMATRQSKRYVAQQIIVFGVPEIGSITLL